MKKLRQLLNETADQMLSTFLMVFSVYCLVKGVQGLFRETPPLWAFLVVAGFGFFLGLVKTLTYKTPTYGNDSQKNNVED